VCEKGGVEFISARRTKKFSGVEAHVKSAEMFEALE
jgi:hypothetical protein